MKLDVAVTAADIAAVRLIAAARFAASVVVSVVVEKNVVVFVPSAPPVNVPAPAHVNPVRPLESVMLLPAMPLLTAVTATVVVPLAVARVLAEFLVIAAAMFVPSVAALTPAAPDQIWKFDPAFEPSVPETCDSVKVLKGKLVRAKPVEPKFTACSKMGLAVPDVTTARLLGKSLGPVQTQVEELPPVPDIAFARFAAAMAAVSVRTAHLPFPFGAETVPEF